MKDMTIVEWICVAGLIFCLLGGPAIWVLSSYNEAMVYNKLTGAHVTTWDAMWVELRIQEQPTK